MKNRRRSRRSKRLSPVPGATETFLDGVGHNLKAGDAIVFVGQEFKAHPTTNNNWDFRLIDSVTTDPDRNRTRVRWKRGLGSVSPFSNPPVSPEVHVLRRRAGAFGHNAPLWLSMN